MHEAESSLESRIEQALVDTYGRSAVARQHVYHTGRRVDLLVDVGLLSIAIECESRPGSLIPGMGQVLHYASHDPQGRTVPCLVVADGHALESPEREYVEERVAVFTESELLGRLGAE